MTGIAEIVWNVDPAILHIGGFELRYYSIGWALAIAIGLWFFVNFTRREGLPEKVSDSIFLYGTIATILGARLGHCLFYDFEHYMLNPIEILGFNGEGRFVGFAGLASHGAAIGLLIGLWLFSRKNKLPYIWSLDRIMVAVTIGGAIVRIGNLMNSEIYGVETSLPWGFIFVRAGETVPKHPTQIYEALCYLVTFLILVWLYYRRDMARRRPGVMFGVGLIGVFLTRIFIECIKNVQESFEESMILNMGQLLSIPFVLLGIGIIIWSFVNGKKTKSDGCSR